MSLYQPAARFARIQSFYAVPLEQFHMTAHAHDRCEIMYVVSGACEIAVDGHVRRLGERDFIFLDAQVPHSLDVTPKTPCTLLNLEFSLHDAPPGIELRPLVQQCAEYRHFLAAEKPYLLLQDSRKTGYALKDLIAQLQSFQRDDFLDALLFQRLMRELCGCVGRTEGHAGSAHLNNALRYIQARLFERLSVAEIAGHTGINAAYLQTLFAGRFSCGIMAYVNRQRMEYACFLLKNSDKSVTDIAYALGYNSRQHFGYLFARAYQISPLHYRQINSQTIEADTGRLQLIVDEQGEFRPFVLRQGGE